MPDVVNKCYNIVYLESACIIQPRSYGALKAGVHTGRDPFSSSPFSSFPRLIVIAVFLDSLQNKFAEMDFFLPRHSRPKTANIDSQLLVCKRN